MSNPRSFRNRVTDLLGGDMNASIALSGQVAGRIDSVLPVAEILRSTVREFFEVIEDLSARYLPKKA